MDSNQQNGRSEAEAANLRKKIDALVLEAMTGDDEQASVALLLAGLSEISLTAANAGVTEIPAAVDSTLAQIPQPPTANSQVREQLLSCVSLLRNILEQCGVATPPESSQGPDPQPVSAVPLSADPELLNDFLMESRDHLASIETQLLTLEREPSDADAIHSIFRSFHTIKGLAGFLDLNSIRDVAHEVETLLDMARNGELSVTPSTIDVVLESADHLKAEMSRVEGRLNGNISAAVPDAGKLVARIQRQMYLVDTEPAEPQAMGNPFPASESVTMSPLSHDDTAQTHDQQAPVNAAKATSAESRVVKVDIGKLDFLMDVVGELVIAQSMVAHDRSAEAAVNPKLQSNLAQLSRITGEVQKTAMAMRMVPIGQLFKRSVRLLRDLMRKSGKDADLILSGEETEVDRNIVEELADPLMHMIRNAADHAIETPEERIKAGKSGKGRIQLKASHQAGSILIEVSDDGRGLDREKILNKARERGLISDGSQLSDREVFTLIFEPGFSTAEKVTDLSGRGVGMDVVRKQIQRMRGRIDIESKAGHGTTFHLKLPLTLAIIDGLIVGVGGERYIAPLYAVREMFRPAAESVFTVEGQAEMVLVRGALIPIIRLCQRFNLRPRSTEITESLLVVVESETRRFCVVVDELIDTQEVVIKNLGETFRGAHGIAGGTILGDGRVGLILDIDGLFTGCAHA